MTTSQTNPQTPIAGLLTRVKTADGLFVTDGEQRITHWSETAERILGIPGLEAVGRRCFEVLVGKDFSGQPFCRSECPVSRNARKHRPVRDYEITVDRGAAGRKTINNSIVLWRAGSGEEVVHLFREVKSRKPVPRLRSRRKAEPDEVSATPLSRREHEILKLAATGLRTAQIAEAAGVSVYTARNQLSSVMRKLNVRSRMEAIVLAHEAGLL